MTRANLLIIAAIVVIAPGCFREVIDDEHTLRTSTSVNIVVLTSDGWHYSFGKGNYEVQTDSTGGQVLTGSGKRYRSGKTSFESFEGSLSFSDIEKVTHSEPDATGMFIVYGTLGFLLTYGISQLFTYH